MSSRMMTYTILKNEIKTSQQCLISPRKHFSNCDYANYVKQIRYILITIPEYVEVKPNKFTTAVSVSVDLLLVLLSEHPQFSFHSNFHE